jgi:hypothetical protein
MSMTRTEALKKVLEMRDFAERMESDLKTNMPEIAPHTPFVCVHMLNTFARPAQKIHVHIDSALLTLCVDALSDSLIATPEVSKEQPAKLEQKPERPAAPSSIKDMLPRWWRRPQGK